MGGLFKQHFQVIFILKQLLQLVPQSGKLTLHSRLLTNQLLILTLEHSDPVFDVSHFLIKAWLLVAKLLLKIFFQLVDMLLQLFCCQIEAFVSQSPPFLLLIQVSL